MTAPAPFFAPPALEAPLQLEALSLTRRVPGPGLAGRTSVCIVANITAADGSPVTGLSQEAFEVQTVAGPTPHRSTSRSVPLHIAIMETQETAPGIYTLSFGPDSAATGHELQVLALFVHESSTGRDGRTLVRLER